MRIFCLYKVEQHAVTSNLKGSIHFLNNFSTFSLCGTEPVPALTEREADYKISFGFSWIVSFWSSLSLTKRKHKTTYHTVEVRFSSRCVRKNHLLVWSMVWNDIPTTERGATTPIMPRSSGLGTRSWERRHSRVNY